MLTLIIVLFISRLHGLPILVHHLPLDFCFGTPLGAPFEGIDRAFATLCHLCQIARLGFICVNPERNVITVWYAVGQITNVARISPIFCACHASCSSLYGIVWILEAQGEIPHNSSP